MGKQFDMNEDRNIDSIEIDGFEKGVQVMAESLQARVPGVAGIVEVIKASLDSWIARQREFNQVRDEKSTNAP